MKLENVADVYRLTPAQEGMFFHTLLEPGRGMYLVQLERDLKGIDPAALRAAFERLVVRHPPLRTAFLWEGLDRPQQVVRTHVELPFAEHDWRGLEEPERERKLEELLEADRGRDFDLARAPLVRVALVRLRDERSRLVWTFHHLLLDGWSVSLLSEELEALYAAELRGTEAPPTQRRRTLWSCPEPWCRTGPLGRARSPDERSARLGRSSPVFW